MPQGQRDMTRPENYPDANYWGVTAGTQYLDDALARALRDHDSTSALHIIHSLQQIVGQSNLFSGKSTNDPLINAMAYPDRLVRFEAAFAIANSLPQQPFGGQERVVPLLAEALAQTGTGNVVLVLPTQDQANAMVDALKKSAGLNVTGVTTAEAAITAANAMPSIDVIAVSDELPAGEIDRLFQLASGSPKLLGAAHLVIVKTDASPYVQRAATDASLSTTKATDPAGLQAAITDAMRKGGALPLGPQSASEYAIRSGTLLRWLAISRGQVLDITSAKTALLAAMNDPRPEVVKIAGQVLGLLNDKDAQTALLIKATDAKTSDDVKVNIYNSLGCNARFFGNLLTADQVQTLTKSAEDAPNLQVRSAAAEARGTLSLPADQAKNLIVEQAR